MPWRLAARDAGAELALAPFDPGALGDGNAVVAALAAERIAVWSGDYYAAEAMATLALGDRGGAVRAGVSRYTSAEDVERLVSAVTGL